LRPRLKLRLGPKRSQEAEEKKLCPRCGQPYSYIESYTKGSQKYYVAVHYEGYQKAEGKVKKRVRKCYLGPQVYKYVEKLHGLGSQAQSIKSASSDTSRSSSTKWT